MAEECTNKDISVGSASKKVVLKNKNKTKSAVNEVVRDFLIEKESISLEDKEEK